MPIAWPPLLKLLAKNLKFLPAPALENFLSAHIKVAGGHPAPAFP